MTAERRRAPAVGDFLGDPVDRVVSDVDHDGRRFKSVKLGLPEGCPLVLEGLQGMWFRAAATPIEDGWTEETA